MKFQYDGAIFAVKGSDSSSILEQDTGIFPGAHSNINVFNVGRTDIYCNLRYGTKISWIGTITAGTVTVGETKLFNNGGRPYYVTGMKLQNDTSKRSIVCAHYQYGGGGAGGEYDLNINVNNALRQLAAAGLKYVPYVGAGLSFLLLQFWPEQKKSVWDQVKNQVEELVDKKIIQTISGLLEGDINQYKEQINVVVLKIENEEKKDAATQYMNVAQHLIGFENKFIFGDSHSDHMNINYALLPLYSHVIHMKMLYYLIGIDQADKIGLTTENVNDIKGYADRLLNEKTNGVKQYMKNIYKKHVDYVYDTCPAVSVYNHMMTARAYIAVNGLEYLPIWDYMLHNPSEKDAKVYNDAISYSLYHGRQTSNLARVACIEEQEQPLTPKLVNDRRNKVKSVEVHMWRIYNGRGPPKIGGLRVNFENGDSHFMGEANSETQVVEWKGARLNKLTVWGRGALDMFTFNFSDGREVTVGTNDNSYGVNTVFELEKHHIVGFYLAGDFASTAGQANNVAVSYQLTVE